MVEHAGTLPDAAPSLDDSRAQFVASLGRRLEALRQALFALEQAPRSPALRDHLRRRIHAFGAAAGVLGFERVFEAFREAESVLASAGGAAPLGQAELAMVARTVDLVPSLVLGAAGPSLRAAAGDRRPTPWPTQVLVFGAAAVAASLESAGAPGSPALECDHADDSARAEEIVRVTAPDVAVVDADRPGAREFIETLTYDPLLDPVKIVAVGFFDRPEAAATLVGLGVARVLAKPVSPDSLKRVILEVAADRGPSAQRAEPIGEVTVEALGERLAQEIRRGLVDAVKAQGRDATVVLGEGTDVLAAIWSSVARVRELVTLRSGGAVRFDATGPEGAVPLAPWMGASGNGIADRLRAAGPGEARSAEGVSLSGRTIVVVDDDPAVVWFLSGLLRAAGAEVIESHDGARALELSRAAWPDLIVSDILMPGLDGFALCREVKRDVALSDVPVILLSWKEDLLQRMRELGADADGYLRKEATASTVVQRAREVLLPRARVESRLASGVDVRGRLDGLTPRLVLELVCKVTKDAKVSVRDAAYLYEVEVRGGLVRSANRTSTEGAFERGERVLSALLGVRAGRFAVRRDDSACASDWDVPLTELVNRATERARAAQQVLRDLRRVAHVEIDDTALEPYLAAMPRSIGSVVQRLVEGVPPADLLAEGTSAPLLESVLVDLVLHGAIFRIGDVDGEDLLARGLAAIREREAAVELPAARDFRTPAPPGVVSADEAPLPARKVVDFALGPGPAVVDLLPASDSVWAEPDPSPGPPPVAFPSRPPEGDGGFASLLMDSVVPPAYVEERREPRPQQKGMAPPTSAPAEPSPLETALRSLPRSSRPRAPEEPASPDASAPVGPAESAAPSTSALPVAGAAAAVPEAPPEAGAVESAEPPPSARATAASLVPDMRAPEPAPSSQPSPPAARAAVETPKGPPSAKQPFAEAPRDDGAPPIRTDSLPPTRKEGASDPAAAPRKPTPRSVEAYATKVVGAPSAESRASESSAPARSEPKASVAPVPSASLEESAAAATLPDPDVDPHSRPTPVGPPSRSPQEAAPKSDDGAFDLGDAVLSALEGKEASKTPAQAPAAKAREPAASTQPPRTARGTPSPRTVTKPRTPSSAARAPKDREQKAEKKKAPPAPPAKDPGSGGVAAIVTIVVISAASTFGLATALRSGGHHLVRVEAPPAAQIEPAPSAEIAPGATTPEAPSAVPPLVGAEQALASSEMELPQGLSVPADRGVLEFDVGGASSLYVDGVFVGVGPSRVLLLRSGPHEVRVEANGKMIVGLAQIKTGRRTHLALASSQ